MSSRSSILSAGVQRVRKGVVHCEAPCIVMEVEMVKIMFCVLVFIATAALSVHFAIGAAAGDGASMLWLLALSTAFLAFVGLILRPWLWLRAVFVAGALAGAALLVDQVAYTIWHEQFDGFVSGLRHDVEKGSPDLAERMSLRPTSLRIEPGQALLFTFEPPGLAWTYHLGAGSPEGQRIVARWHRLLARSVSDVQVDAFAQTIIEPHQAFSVS